MAFARIRGALAAHAAALVLCLALAGPSWAVAVGDSVRNPVTKSNETVSKLLTDSGGAVTSVLTTAGNVIILSPPADGSTVVSNGISYTVKVLTKNDLNETLTYSLTPPGQNPTVTTVSVVTDVSSTIAPPPSTGTPPGSATEVVPSAPSGNSYIFRTGQGGSGSNGDDGWGVEICDPIFGLGCTIIGESAEAGGAGSPGPTIDWTLTGGASINPASSESVSNGTVVVPNAGFQTTQNGLSGITAISIGGNGGNGGDAYSANFSAANGGPAGAGGTVTVDNRVNVTTSGNAAHGIFAASLGGKGGDGGTGYSITGGGGSGGPPSVGGTVTVTNEGSIQTSGEGSIGIFAQSRGGGGGSGGDSYGVVGGAGAGSEGGTGGTVIVTNKGYILTDGTASYGIMAQSLGGSGGGGGTGGGLVSFGGSGSDGGGGGAVTVNNEFKSGITNSGKIQTQGDRSHAIFAQSIGGGGGAGGSAGGIAAFGGSGSGGGSAAAVTVTTQAGTSLITTGAESHGILAQSIGGGGGAGASSGGLFAMGGSGSAGGSSGKVTVNNSGSIQTDAGGRGIFAQSIAGGGGAASGSGGFVTLGGRGGVGGTAGEVEVKNYGTISTKGTGGDGILAQSIGGGGGAGAAAGGVVSLGGASSQGGAAAKVAVTHEGSIFTDGRLANGIFAQSIGGGGGAGGASYGLVSIGGSGGAGGAAGAVEVTTSNGSGITTKGDLSHGIFAQSIGGGGGSGGSTGGALAIGGSGTAAGNGNTVTVTNRSTIITEGEDSRGIFAQSIGGGGGSSAGSGGLVSLGGSGSSGGRGETVTVTNYGRIDTAKAGSDAIFAQSIGGGGGSGAGSGGLVSLGGRGSGGGNGGGVTVTNAGDLTADGARARGIFAQSIGGGGGSGGDSGGLVSIGGRGGVASAGGNVTVGNTGSIYTKGSTGNAIFAQSIGGGGGDGGTSGGPISIGGSAGGGGNGGVVTLTNTGAIISTTGSGATAIVAQSVGGGGGNGGGSFGFSSVGAVAIGGSGGLGGTGGNVFVNKDLLATDTASSTIITTGAQAHGIQAQSVGGGGGNGGFAVSASAGASVSASIALGGSGGDGGDSGNVTAKTKGSVSTNGADSVGVFAQSIGGGGGNGGWTVAAGISDTLSVSVAVGGKGGGGGNSGAVTVGSYAAITTTGDRSHGIQAQSIGGGGGNGGFSVSAAQGGAFGGSLGIGGSGGDGGTSGIVNLTSSGNITTEGEQSHAIFAQSIGGGGGSGGFSVAAGLGTAGAAVAIGGSGGSGQSAETVTVTSTGKLHTKNLGSNAILAQSIGGGGGNGGWSGAMGGGIAAGIGVGVGGSGGGGSVAAKVTVGQSGDVTTEKDGSSGIVAQSIGGGGGNGGFAIATSGSGGIPGLSVAASVGVGGSGGDGSTGGEVALTSSNGTIYTSGARSNGIVAQSIGGGGGNGGFSVAAAATLNAGIGVAVGGSGGEGNDSGLVTVTSGYITGTQAPGTTDITLKTVGNQSSGVVAQSIGGGGGNGGFAASGAFTLQGGAVAVGVGGSGAGGGNAGNVVANIGHNIKTEGDQSYGIFAQSIGGGGGDGGFALGAGGGSYGGIAVGVGGSGDKGGNAGTVNVTSKGNITTGLVDSDGNSISGTGSTGIFAQSIGGGGGNGGWSATAVLGGNGAIGVSVGGSGDGGGNASTVTVTQTGNVTTRGADSAHGVLAQSIGGGGNGGFSGALGISYSGGAMTVGVGGLGGAGGTGGNVTAAVTGNVSTKGNNSYGVIVQSIGGGGGNGGGAVAANGAKIGAIGVAVGGSGGAGNAAGTARVDYAGTLTTAGDKSIGILAQSIGGGGGNGGFAVSGGLTSEGPGNVNIGIGGKGGAGSDGKTVTVNSNLAKTDILDGNTATIHTKGKDADGISAQSIGGGGGNGGFAGAVSFTGGGATNVAVGVGGFGADGGKGDIVTVKSFDNILTEGIGANAILAQSIGGGGGNGGFGFAGTINKTGVGEQIGISAAIGGFGGEGSGAGAVYVDSTGGIETKGDKAMGVLAQSIGGGGGNGGLAISLTGSTSAGGTNFSAAIGGFGDEGGEAQYVEVLRKGSIKTGGEGAIGIQAQSIGGGGGNGGLALSGALGIAGGSKNFSAAIGGFGGSGANAGRVKIDTQGIITTTGIKSNGILAQSIGGGGGNGGLAGSFVLGLGGPEETSSVNINATIGGFGGGGGTAAKVEVKNVGAIFTEGDEAAGIVAQSIGGGGGDGGRAVSITIGLKGNELGGTTNVNFAVGGFGGVGATAGDVVVDHSGGTMVVEGETVRGRIATLGAGAHGIKAQSIGGGGGSGGSSNSISLILDGSEKCPSDGECPEKPTNTSIQVAVGGRGGSGNDAGKVTVTSDDVITTTGFVAHGIFAQSIGGGGGSGGNAVIGAAGLFPVDLPVDPALILKAWNKVGFTRNLSVGIGGSGGGSGDGGIVEVTNKGSIGVNNVGSYGIYAQSIGGGGGTGGNAVVGITGTVAIGGGQVDSLLGLAPSIGDGKDVTVTNMANASIVAKGLVFSGGIFAQSIGGGGGQGGLGSGLIAIGADGNSSGDGGKVTVDNKGFISSDGIMSDAILAQSIGGGGGTGGGTGLTVVGLGGKGGASGNGGLVTVKNSGNVLTKGEISAAIVAQSIGGGGGKAGGRNPDRGIIPTITSANVVSIGGKGGSAGDGGEVLVENTGQIETRSFFSMAILAQSIGGGGGQSTEGLGAVALGGVGGSAGDGGLVTVKNKTAGATILTRGDYSVGIFAQSVGGGGGAAGESIGIVTIDARASGGGDGAAVVVENAAGIMTLGHNASAIFAQSLGGGGGYAAGSNGIATFGADAGDGGNGGTVTVDNDGEIVTAGANSHGIFAQSVGGGGGVVNGLSTTVASWKFTGSAGGMGDAGDVTVTQTGDIDTSGNNSFGILAQSEGKTVNGDINVTLESGMVIGGASAGTGIGGGVGLLDGKDNKLINRGSIMARGALIDPLAREVMQSAVTVLTIDDLIEGTAVYGTGGNDSVDNYNFMLGNIMLGSGGNDFTNKAGSIYVAGSTVDLGGPDNLFTNEGILRPKGTGSIDSVYRTTLNGSFTQSATGHFEVDLDFVSGDAVVGLADRIDVSGGASLEGALDLYIVNPNQAAPGYHEITLITTNDGIETAALTLNAPISAVTKYGLLYPGMQDLVLSYEIDFSPLGLNANQTSIGDFINRMQLAGGTERLAPLVGTVFLIEKQEDLARAYDMLSPEAYATTVASMVGSGKDFNNALMSCRERFGEYRYIAQGECGWARATARSSEYWGSPDAFGWNEEAYQMAGGLQKKISDHWHIGAAAAWEGTNTDIGERAHVEGDRAMGGLVLKGRAGATTLAASLSGGYGWFNSTRQVPLGDVGGTYRGNQEISFMGSNLRLAHMFQDGSVYMQPIIDAGYTRVHQYEFTEEGEGLANLTIDARTDSYIMLTPSLEIGAEIALDGWQHAIRPRARIGVTQILGDQEAGVSAMLVGVPDDVLPFDVSAGMDETVGSLELGLDVVFDNNVAIRMDGLGMFGKNTEAYQGNLKLSVPF